MNLIKNSTDFLNLNVTVTVDRPLGSKHPKYGFHYPLNYGYIAGILGKDGEDLDAYILGVNHPVQSFSGQCIAIIKRLDDEDDKLVVVPEDLSFSVEEIKDLTLFQEQWFQSEIITPNSTPPPILDFTRGDPPDNTPETIAKKGIEAIQFGNTHYTDPKGTEQLRQLISNSLSDEFNLQYHPQEILVTSGSSLGITTSILSLTSPGDEILIPDPGWPTYQKIIHQLHRKSVYYPMPFDGREISPQDYCKTLNSMVSSRTRMIIVNTPHNPTGFVLGREWLSALEDFLIKHPDIYLMSDETYRHLIFDGRTHISPAIFPTVKSRTIVIHSLSKSFLMTGWRMAYLAASAPCIEKISSLHIASNCCASSITQKAAEQAIQMPSSYFDTLNKYYENLRNFLVENLNKISHFNCDLPQGTFYLFANIAGFGISSLELTSQLKRSQKVYLYPGSLYGSSGEGFVRICFCNRTS
jgi:aspartate/methionine/tyrosine aminotransferase